MVTDDAVLTTKQVAELYPFLRAPSLRSWRHTRTGPPSFSIGRKVLYRKSEIDAWIAAQEEATRRGGDAA